MQASPGRKTIFPCGRVTRTVARRSADLVSSSRSLNDGSSSIQFEIMGQPETSEGDHGHCFDISRCSELSSVWRVETEPFVLDLLVVDRRIVFRDIEVQIAHRQAANRRERGEGRDHTIMLRDDEIDPRAQ